MKWYEMSVNQKKQMIKDCWKELDITHMSLLVDTFPDIDNEPVDRDGRIIFWLRTHEHHLIVEYEISYRSIHPDNRKYIKHILKTGSLDLAKCYFNIPKEI